MSSTAGSMSSIAFEETYSEVSSYCESNRSVRFNMTADYAKTAESRPQRLRTRGSTASSSSSSSSCAVSDSKHNNKSNNDTPAADGFTWRPGMRVVTRCALSGPDGKVAHPPGPGRVWRALPDGLLLIALDAADCSIQLVCAEPSDVELTCAHLPERSTVRARGLFISSPTGPIEVPSTEVGEVIAYQAVRNAYDIAFWGLDVRVSVPTRVVQVIALPTSPRRDAAAADEKRGTSDSNRSLLAKMASSFVRRLPFRTRTVSLAAAAEGADATPPAASSDTSSRAVEILNLRKQPSNSNIRGAPTAYRNSTAPATPAVQALAG